MPRQLPPVDDDVFEALQGLAEPLIDDISTVLRRLLGLHHQDHTSPAGTSESRQATSTRGHEEADRRSASLSTSPKTQRSSRASHGRKRGAARPRAARGTLLPELEYEVPLLRALDERDGSAAASEVIESVGAALKDRLTDADRETLDSGLTRWKNRVQFVRLKLVHAGQVKKGSPRGIWQIAPAGRDRLSGIDRNE